MEIGEYIGLDYGKQYTKDELNNIFSKFNNLSMRNFCVKISAICLLNKQDSSLIIKFINMFKDINELENERLGQQYSVAGNILYIIRSMRTNKNICVYKIMYHMLELNMNINITCVGGRRTENCLEYYNASRYNNINNYDVVKYVVANYNVIQNVRKIINNYDILLFDITNDLPLIESMLLIISCKQKNLPKFVITHKILYYYLLEKNDIYNC